MNQREERSYVIDSKTKGEDTLLIRFQYPFFLKVFLEHTYVLGTVLCPKHSAGERSPEGRSSNYSTLGSH